MKLIINTARHYADAMLRLLPPGDVWQWPLDGLGDQLFLALSQALVRIELALQLILDDAIEQHRPGESNYHITAYRQLIQDTLTNAGIAETMPRKTFAAGSKAGERLWSSNGPNTTFPVALFTVDDDVKPLTAGFKVGERTWSSRSRFYLRVRYYQSVVDPKMLFTALNAFRQAHVYIWFEDITGRGGLINYETN